MAYNVNFLKGSAQSFADLAVKSKNTFYYIDEKDLYIGDVKLTNGADLALAVTDIAKNKSDIDIIKAQLEDLTGGEGGDSSVVELISDLSARLGAAEQAITTETNRAKQEEGKLSSSVEQLISDLESLNNAVNTNKTDIEEEVSKLDKRVTLNETDIESTAALLESTITKVQEHTTSITTIQGDISDLEVITNLLVGSDADKSVRDIAMEVLAEQLLADAGMTENFASLQELAAWLADHPEQAADMNLAIQQNASAIQALDGTVSSHTTTIEGLLRSLAEIQDEDTGILALSKQYTDARIRAIDSTLTDYISSNNKAVKDLKDEVDEINDPASGLLAQAQNKINELQQRLGTAAYKSVEDFDAAGSAAAALEESKAYTDAALTWGEIKN